VSTSAVPVVYTRIPNAITVLRFALVPVFVVLLVEAKGGHSLAAAIVFAIAGISDQVDGALARRWQVESEFGKYADPLADRLMIDAAVLLLFFAARLPWAGIVIVFGRDVLLIAGARFAQPRGYEFSVNFLGKTATWILYLAVGCILITYPSDHWPLVLFWAGVGLAVAAAIVYAVGVRRAVSGQTRSGEENEPPAQISSRG
jgi:CDP-diacylglycerol--glycerol-3-phosphate 3-phosphatidyltransferase